MLPRPIFLFALWVTLALSAYDAREDPIRVCFSHDTRCGGRLFASNARLFATGRIVLGVCFATWASGGVAACVLSVWVRSVWAAWLPWLWVGACGGVWVPAAVGCCGLPGGAVGERLVWQGVPVGWGAAGVAGVCRWGGCWWLAGRWRLAGRGWLAGRWCQLRRGGGPFRWGVF